MSDQDTDDEDNDTDKEKVDEDTALLDSGEEDADTDIPENDGVQKRSVKRRIEELEEEKWLRDALGDL